MPYSIMEALFSGKIIPWERRHTATAKRKETEEKIENEKQYFLERLSPEDAERFETLEDLYHDMIFYEEADTYSHGFTLGALLMQEVMEKKGEMAGE